MLELIVRDGLSLDAHEVELSTPHTERSNAARKAASQLMRSDLDAADLKSPEAIDWLADIALHIASLDPIEIGAGAILESGHDREHEQLTLGLLILLLVTQAEPQMVEYARPNLGRLVQPRHYKAWPRRSRGGCRGPPITPATREARFIPSDALEIFETANEGGRVPSREPAMSWQRRRRE